MHLHTDFVTASGVRTMSQQQPRETMANWQKKLLEATGNAWQVDCYESGNHRRVVRIVYIRAPTRERAEAIARSVSRKKCVSARPWDPTGVGLQRFIRRQQESTE